MLDTRCAVWIKCRASVAPKSNLFSKTRRMKSTASEPGLIFLINYSGIYSVWSDFGVLLLFLFFLFFFLLLFKNIADMGSCENVLSWEIVQNLLMIIFYISPNIWGQLLVKICALTKISLNEEFFLIDLGFTDNLFDFL